MNATGCPACLARWPEASSRIVDLGLTVAHLHDDQFFPGWTILVLKRHATELYELTGEERAGLIEEVTRAARVLATAYGARKMNYALLGNQIPHIHWHIVPRLGSDPAPDEPVFGHRHAPHRLAPDDLAARVSELRRAFQG